MTKTTGQHKVTVVFSIAEARALSFVAREQFPSTPYKAVLDDGRTLNAETYTDERRRGYLAMLKLEKAITKRIKALERKKGDHHATDERTKESS